jgi:hypothetical protein
MIITILARTSLTAGFFCLFPKLKKEGGKPRMIRHLSHPTRLVFVSLSICVLMICGLTACGKAEAPPEEQQTATEPTTAPSEPADEALLYPTDVQTLTEGDGRQIVKTYTLKDGDDPSSIPRDSFISEGWQYELTDVTEDNTGGTDTRPHVETVEIDTDSNDLDEVMELLAPMLEHESEDGYSGTLTLDVDSIECEAAGYENSGYAVTVTREYPDLPANDLYFIPKTITENGQTLALDGVEWEAQSSVNVGYSDIPSSYRAIAQYTGTASQRVATGYVTTADYAGEITKEIAGETTYVAHFEGKEIIPVSQETEQTDASEPASTTAPAPDADSTAIPVIPIISAVVIIILLGGAAAFFFLRHNVKVYSVSGHGNRVPVAKVRISAKNPEIDLTPLGGRSDNRVFVLEIDRLASKTLDGVKLCVVLDDLRMYHKLAYEGDAYCIEANFNEVSIKAIY